MSNKNITVLETTLEKVLSILNKVKIFITNNTKNYKNIIEELDWVKKVITNETLYTYEVNKDKLTDDNQKFLDFVIKYNEDVINLNKKHVLVRDILSMKTDKDFLQKPSLVLKKLSSEELNLSTYNSQNYKTKKSVANPLGRWVLNLYYKKQEENKNNLSKNDVCSRNIRNNNIKNTSIDKNISIKSTSLNKLKKNKNKNESLQLSSSLTSLSNNQKAGVSPNKLTKVKTNINRNKNLKYSSYLKYKNINLNVLTVKKTTERYFINEMEKKRKKYFYNNISHKKEESKNNNNDNSIIKENIISNNINPKYLTTLIEKHFEFMRTIYDKDFDIFNLKKLVGYQNVLPLMCHFMFKIFGLIDSRIIRVKKLIPFLTTVSDNYLESTLYHNSLHGADVCHSLFIYIINSNFEEICETTVLDILGLMVSATGHDLGHPGYNNNYHINSSSELAIKYNDISCLENFHTSTLFRILRKDENNIFENMDVNDYKHIRKRIVNQILATDMVNHAMVLSSVKAKISSFELDNDSKENKKFIFLSGVENSKFDEQQMMFNYLIHTADLGHNTQKFEISLQWVELLTYEFWKQGDSEKEKNLNISFLCDRNNVDVPTSQVGFLRAFILTTFDILVTMFPNLEFTVNNAKNNINEWQKLSDQKKRTGWTPKKKNKNEDEKFN